MKVDKVTIVGSGNVAEAFARSLKAASIEVVQLFARNRERGEFVASLAGCEFCSEPDKLKA
ncbi:MAG: DUF2520 domain-containing protein, partial [Alistipes sp.]|nr:DUF2520 domain-containing protein [Alistipes sp.]